MSIMKQTNREVETAKKKQKIIESAISLFNKYGYDKTTVADISYASGMSTGSIYNFFGNKAGIVSDIVKEIYEKSAEYLDIELDEKSCIGQNILNYYLFAAEKYEKYDRETLKAYTEAHSSNYYSGKQNEFIELSHGQIEKYLLQAVEKDLWFPEDSIAETVELVHMQFVGCLMIWIYYSIHDNLKNTVERNLSKILNKLNLL